ncbi:MAG: hypothetical protein ACE5IG_01660 [Dehalococcoidia bacterium]
MPQRIIDVQYTPDDGLTLRFRPGVLREMSAQSRRRFRSTNRKLLVALRGWLNEAITWLEEENPRHRARKVKVKGGKEG